MEKQRFVETGGNSFYGEYLYDQIVSQDHFMRKWKTILDWEYFTQRLIKIYKGEGVVGRPPFDPAMILKIELIAYLYNLSERQVEVFVNENLPAKYFVGLAVDGRAPDHSTLTVFRERLVRNGKLKIFEEMLDTIVKEAQGRGVKFGRLQLVDSVHTVANVNTAKDQGRQKKGGKGRRDPDAQWGAKHQRKVKNEQGKEEEQIEYFYGYKSHISLNAESGMITSLKVTSGEAYDGHLFRALVDHDLEQGVPAATYAADKGYDDGDNHLHLEIHGKHSAIRIKDNRLRKKDKNQQVWLDWVQTRQYQEGLKERYKIERKFGEAKQGHGLGRCRYIGKVKFAVQAFFTVIMPNLKRMVKVLTGVGFKTNCPSTT